MQIRTADVHTLNSAGSDPGGAGLAEVLERLIDLAVAVVVQAVADFVLPTAIQIIQISQCIAVVIHTVRATRRAWWAFHAAKRGHRVAERAGLIGSADHEPGCLTGPDTNSALLTQVGKRIVDLAVVIVVEAVADFLRLAQAFLMIHQTVAVVVNRVEAGVIIRAVSPFQTGGTWLSVTLGREFVST